MDREMKCRRVAFIPEILLTILKDTDFIVLKNGNQIRFDHELPEDTEFHHAYLNPENHTFEMIVTSEQFPSLKLGEHITAESVSVWVHESSRRS